MALCGFREPEGASPGPKLRSNVAFCSVRLAVTWQRGELDHRDLFSPLLLIGPHWEEKGS